MTISQAAAEILVVDAPGQQPSPEHSFETMVAYQRTAALKAAVTRVGRLAVGQIVVLHRRPSLAGN